MRPQSSERVESAIIQLVAQFPGLLGPVGIQAALKTVFGMTGLEAAQAGHDLVLLETLGLIFSQDLGKGRFVYRLTGRGHKMLGGNRVRIQLRRQARPRRVPAGAHQPSAIEVQLSP
jgi:hypothetical protein